MDQEILVQNKSLASRESLIIKKKLRDKRLKLKTRNFSIRSNSGANEDSRNSSISRLKPYESIANIAMASTTHKRSGTTLIGSSVKMADSININNKSKKVLKKDTQKLKISKEILKRLKRRSINQYSEKFKNFTNEKSRMSNLDVNKVFGENTNNWATSTFKKSKGIYNEIPLPISSTSKRLKKAIKDSKLY